MGILNHALCSGTVDSSLLQFFDSLRFDFATNYKAFSFIVLISGRRRNPQRGQLDNDLFIILVGYKFPGDDCVKNESIHESC